MNLEQLKKLTSGEINKTFIDNLSATGTVISNKDGILENACFEYVCISETISTSTGDGELLCVSGGKESLGIAAITPRALGSPTHRVWINQSAVLRGDFSCPRSATRNPVLPFSVKQPCLLACRRHMSAPAWKALYTLNKVLGSGGMAAVKFTRLTSYTELKKRGPKKPPGDSSFGGGMPYSGNPPSNRPGGGSSSSCDMLSDYLYNSDTSLVAGFFTEQIGVTLGRGLFLFLIYRVTKKLSQTPKSVFW